MKPSLRSFLKICLVVVGFITASPGKAQWVTIPDSAFAAYLRYDQPNCMNGNQLDTNCAEALTAPGFFMTGSRVKNLEGIRHFKNLLTLVCEGCKELDSLPTLPKKLKYLQLPQCELGRLPDSLPNLTLLDCSFNNLVGLPTLPPTLRTLDCSDNQLTSLPPMPDTLRSLNCSFNLLTSLPDLPKTLVELIANNNDLRYLPDLPEVMSCIFVNNNLNLICMPPIKRMTRFIGFVYFFKIHETGIKCLPNFIAHDVDPGMLTLDTVPVCDFYNNPNGCELYWNIQGRVYKDDNANCRQDSNETRISPIKVNLYESGALVQSAFFQDGSYTFDADFSIYTVAIDTTNLPFIAICPTSGDTTIAITGQDSLRSDINFGVKCKPGFDVGAKSMVGGLFRPTWNTQINIHAGDMVNAYGLYCASGVSGTVNVSFTGQASYISAAPGALTPTNVSGNTITYNVANFGNINLNKDFNIIVRTDTSTQAGQQICFTVSVTPTVGDNNPSNNILTQCFTVRTSYDPNNKEVSPAGRIDSSQGWLTYTVNFQNTGTDTAIHIYIDDTLDTNLDMASFQLLAYSHPNVTQVLPGGVVKFNFPNIYLPDSNVNEPLSHGYVQYKVKVKNGLTTGSGIRNKAYIYFDFNPPVETNEVFNLFCIPDTTDLIGYVCAGGEGYLFNDTLRVNTGFYSATYTLADGCDSVVNLSLTILPGIPVTRISDTICEGDFYSFNDTLLQMPGNYTTAFQTAEGCDSVVELSLTLKPSVTVASILTICHGGSILFNDTLRTTSGIYSVAYPAANGCDSVHQLNLTVVPEATYHFDVSICRGESYRFKEQDLNMTGVYIDTLQISICDSLTILHLTVDSNDVSIQHISGSDTLLASGMGSIRWIDCNTGQLVPDQYDTVFFSTVISRYAAIFSYANCTDTTGCVIVGYTGLPQTENAEVLLFPNPARDQLMIQAQGFLPERLSIYDVNGRKVSESPFRQPVSVQMLQTGVYYLEVKSIQATVRKRFVKM